VGVNVALVVLWRAEAAPRPTTTTNKRRRKGAAKERDTRETVISRSFILHGFN
jgi:hypothetical protein